MSAEKQTQELVFPRSIGPYRIQRIIGRGAQGVVYLATVQNHPEQQVALKVIENRGNLDRSLIEPELLSRIEHPNIVKLLDYFYYEDRVVLVLEYIDGVNLETYLEKQGRLSPAEVSAFLIQMARALEHAHGRQIIHRDIKLSNVLVHQRGGRTHYVLSDFGVARIASGIQVNRRIGGTYQFMSPEQMRGRPGAQSDLWALGMIAYALLRGHLPFKGKTIQELYDSVMLNTPPPPSDGADPELEKIIYHLLEKRVEARTDSAVALLDELGLAAVKLTPAAQKRSKPSTWEAFVEQKRNQCRGNVYFCLLLGALPAGVIGEVLILAASYLIYLTYLQRMRRAYLIFAVLGLCIGAYIEGEMTNLVISWVGSNEFRSVWHGVGSIWVTIWLYLTCYFAIAARRHNRELLLLRGIRVSDGTAAQILPPLQEFVRVNPGDLAVCQRYVEALLGAGRLREAAVEARLMLRTDPYNVGATLLLANAYCALGLHRACVTLCDAYLAVTGYCFEFADLRERSVLAAGGER